MVMSVWLAEEFAPTSRDVVPADVMGRRCLGGSGNMDPGVPQALGQRFVEMLCEGWPQRAVAKRPAVVFGRRRSSWTPMGRAAPARDGGRSAGAPPPPEGPRAVRASSPPLEWSFSSKLNCGRHMGSCSLNMRWTFRAGMPPPAPPSRIGPRLPGRLPPAGWGRRLPCGDDGGRFRVDGAIGAATVGP